jgi:hypothetical protein
MNNLMYYVFAGFVAFGIAVGIQIGRWSVHCPVCPQIVPVSTTTTPGTPVKQPVLTSTGDTAGVRATTRPHVSYAVHDTMHDTIMLPTAEPKKYYAHPVQDSQRCLTGNEKFGDYRLAWQICGTGIPAFVPRDLFKQFSLVRPDSIPMKTVDLHTAVITKNVGYKWFGYGAVLGVIGGALLGWGLK